MANSAHSIRKLVFCLCLCSARPVPSRPHLNTASMSRPSSSLARGALVGSVEELFGTEEEFTYSCDSAAQTPDDQYFDSVIGQLEDLLLDPEFNSHQRRFLELHCRQFTLPDDYDGDSFGAAARTENALQHTEIFQQYTDQMEQFIEAFLSQRIQDFSMAKFLSILDRKRLESGVEDESQEFLGFSGDVFDLLLSLTDFQQFKVLIIETLADVTQKENERNSEQKDDQMGESGGNRGKTEELDFGLSITGLSVGKSNNSKGKSNKGNKLELAPTVTPLTKFNQKK